MDLLKQVMEQPLDPDYAVLARRGEGSSRHRVLLAVVLVALGALLAVAVLQNTRTAGARATERSELIDRIQDQSARQDQLRTELENRQEEVRRLRESILGTKEDKDLQVELDRLDLLAATVPVKGPGIVVTVDDSPGDTSKGRVMDVDLQQLVNGLWQSGAEAIAINGHRLSARSAIRGAGSAITVNYRSLSRPYRVEAIGDPNTLQSRYIETAGGIWWSSLAQNYGMRHDIAAASELNLPADAGVGLRHARKGS